MTLVPIARRVPFAIASFALVGCVGAAEVVKPEGPRASAALSEGCETVDYARPFVVDWASEDRADLREAEQRGVVVVRHDCDVLRVLTDCHLPGSYAFVGMSAEQTLVEMRSAAEVRANLPFAGGAISAGMSQDTSLFLALAHAGKTTATLEDGAQLTGRCDGATHYVRGVYRGAYAMQTSARGSAHTAADVFGAGAGAATEGHESRARRVGDPGACAGAGADATAPPAGCDAPLRLELRVMGHAPGAGASGSKDATDFVGCPSGFVEVEGRCFPRSESRPYACTPSELEECKVQCERGNAVSCARQAYLLHHGEGRAEQDLPAARALYERACQAGVQHGCSGLGVFYKRGLGGAPKDPKRSFELQRAACDAGEMRGCSSLGVFFDDGEVVLENAEQALRLYRRACEGGYALGCNNLGTLHRDGRGTPVDDVEATHYFLRACLQRSASGCDNLRDLATAGRASGAPIETLKRLYDGECQRGVEPACQSLEALEQAATVEPMSAEPPKP